MKNQLQLVFLPLDLCLLNYKNMSPCQAPRAAKGDTQMCQPT